VERLAGLLITTLITLLTPVSDVAPDRPGPWQARGFVAHAMGVPPDGRVYTNSLEAFASSYAKGFRTFEVDLVRLRDGKVLAAHDRFEQRYGLPQGTRFGHVTAEQMRGRKFDGRWTTLIDGDLIALLERHPDANLILDTKGAMREQVAIARRLARLAPPSVRARLVPHVHNQLQLDALRKLKVFTDYVFATYLWPDKTFADAPAFMTANGLRTVMIGYGYYTEQLRMAFMRAGAHWVFIHSIKPAEDVVRWRLRGVGIYSDDWIMAV
jgi:hypothetical protein